MNDIIVSMDVIYSSNQLSKYVSEYNERVFIPTQVDFTRFANWLNTKLDADGAEIHREGGWLLRFTFKTEEDKTMFILKYL